MKLRVLVLAVFALFVFSPMAFAEEAAAAMEEVNAQARQVQESQAPSCDVEPLAFGPSMLTLPDALADLVPRTHCNGAPDCPFAGTCDDLCGGAGRCVQITGCCICR